MEIMLHTCIHRIYTNDINKTLTSYKPNDSYETSNQIWRVYINSKCSFSKLSMINFIFTERSIKALAAIGPAVFSGGFSTFLAFVLLSRSNSYGFALFFRVCM